MSRARTRRAAGIQRIGRYELKANAGEGASGVVYRAYDPLLDRDVAIKLARTNELTEDEIRHVVDKFHHEARIAGKFAHENIVTIYDVVSEGRLNYMVMEYVPGRSVQEYMDATGPLPVEEALSVGYKCCVGLAYVHYSGVIHRDIKPSNIMYHPAQGIAKLMDFSVAHRIEQPPARDTGTIAYMAPEHFDDGRRISTLTDVFALGSTLYRIITGEYPFQGRYTAHRILNEEPRPMTELRADVPPSVVELVARAMAKADADRHPSAAAFARAIRGEMEQHYPHSSLLDAAHRYLET